MQNMHNQLLLQSNSDTDDIGLAGSQEDVDVLVDLTQMPSPSDHDQAADPQQYVDVFVDLTQGDNPIVTNSTQSSDDDQVPLQAQGESTNTSCFSVTGQAVKISTALLTGGSICYIATTSAADILPSSPLWFIPIGVVGGLNAIYQLLADIHCFDKCSQGSVDFDEIRNFVLDYAQNSGMMYIFFRSIKDAILTAQNPSSVDYIIWQHSVPGRIIMPILSISAAMIAGLTMTVVSKTDVHRLSHRQDNKCHAIVVGALESLEMAAVSVCIMDLFVNNLGILNEFPALLITGGVVGISAINQIIQSCGAKTVAYWIKNLLLGTAKDIALGTFLFRLLNDIGTDITDEANPNKEQESNITFFTSLALSIVYTGWGLMFLRGRSLWQEEQSANRPLLSDNPILALPAGNDNEGKSFCSSVSSCISGVSFFQPADKTKAPQSAPLLIEQGSPDYHSIINADANSVEETTNSDVRSDEIEQSTRCPGLSCIIL